MNRITGVIKIHWQNKGSWFFAPWMVMFSSFVINLFIAFLAGGKTTIYTGGLASIYVFMFILGITTLKDTFPFAIGLCVRRTDYFLGTVAAAFAFCATTSLLLFLFSLVENNLTGGWGVALHFFHLPYVSDGSFIQQLWTSFATLVNMYFLGFVIISVQQRFGRSGMYVFFIIAILLLSSAALASTYLNWWSEIWHWFTQQSAAGLATWTVPVTAVCLLSSFVLLRRATI